MNGGLSRADLLRALLAAPGRLHAGLADALGFHCPQGAAERPQPSPRRAEVTGTRPAERSGGGVEYLPRLRPRYWVVARHEPIERVALEDPEESWPEPEPREYPPTEPLRIPPLRRDGQWQNLWDGTLQGRRRGRRLDLVRSVARLVRAEPVSALPRRERLSFNRPVVVLFQRSYDHYPIWPDMRDAWLSLGRLMGRRALRGYCVHDDPGEEWRRFDRPGSGARRDLPPASQVLLVGTFGALESGEVSASWREFVASLQAAGHRVTLLSACPLHAAPCPHDRLDPGQRTAVRPDRPEERALLAALARLCLPDRAQLRLLRQALPGIGVEVELAVWQHPQVDRPDGYLAMTREVLAEWLAHYPRLPGKWRESLDRALARCGRSLDTVARDMSRLQVVHGERPRAAQFPELLAHVRRAEEKRLCQGALYHHEQALLRCLLAGLGLLGGRPLEPGWGRLMAEAQRVALRSGAPSLLGDRGIEELAGSHELFQRHHGLAHGPVDDAGRRPLLTLASPPYCEQTGSILPAGFSGPHARLDIRDRDSRYGLERITRPPWAERIWRNRDGLFAGHAQGLVLRYREASPARPGGRWEVEDNPWSWAAEVGVDDYGLWAGIRLGDAAQRLRWIPPGRFSMGSPGDEEGRLDDETLHEVELGQGYWLGETTCTRAFWQAVMGETGNERDPLPKGGISWHDGMQFTQRLSELLPGPQWGLPSEAQWEYACRAGTTTAYWWGDRMDGKFANVGSIGPEVAMPPNGFGLRSMSGNLYEWCADWLGEYPEGPVTDPAGPVEGPLRVLRGVSWNAVGGGLRSARRSGFGPGDRYDFVGLRLAGGPDPRAGRGAGGMSADRREWNDRERGAQAAGGGAG